MSNFHEPVLLQETVNFANVQRGKKYIDATLGGGGHTKEILDRGGIVLGIDLDLDSIKYVKENFKFQISNFKLITVHGNFREIDKIAVVNGFEKVAGILFDLGVSSYQLDAGQRGFSIKQDAPLDMRMDQAGLSGKVTAGDLINGLNKGELYELFSKLGEEKLAHAISKRIVSARLRKPIETTGELARLVVDAYEGREKIGKTHVATKVFQALRIVVNDELNNLKEALPKVLPLLEKNGRLAVITFHSLEDRIVKHMFVEFEEKGKGKVITKKPIVAKDAEIERNIRSRSAKLRIFSV